MATSTPWGKSQLTHRIAKGIILYSTASHGGIHLSEKRQKEIKEKFPNFVNFLGRPAWWEEDCDVALVVVAFKDCFSESSFKKAMEVVSKDNYFATARTSQYWRVITGEVAA